jgi:hypothetical protein
VWHKKRRTPPYCLPGETVRRSSARITTSACADVGAGTRDDARVQWGRYQTGASLSAACLAAAAIAAAGSHPVRVVMWVLISIAVLLLVGAFAPAIAGLNRLPVIGAPTITVRPSVEPEHPKLGASAVLRIGIFNHGPGDIARARVNVLDPAPVEQFFASDGFGNRQPTRGERLPDTAEQLIAGRDSAVWFERADLDRGATMLHYLLRFTEPGPCPIRVKIDARVLRSGCVENWSFSIEENPNAR